MNIDDYVAVSKLPGVYRLVSNRNNGIFIEDLDSGKKKFASMRKHMFTPLGTVSIYTEDDSVELSKIFTTMLERSDELDPKAALESNASMFAYFEQILPEYDRERVYVGDVKKVIKWFVFLQDRNLLSLGSDEEE